MRYAVINNGTVDNVIEWDGQTEWTAPEGSTVLEAPEEVGVGYTYDGTTFTAPEPAPEPAVEPIELEPAPE